MDAKVEPGKMTNPPLLLLSPSSPSFSSLPDEIIVNCLARISKSQYRSLSLVSKSFHSLISSPELYAARSQNGSTEPCLYLCIKSPTDHLWYYTLDQTIKEFSLVRVIPSSIDSPAPLHSTILAVGYEIYQIGGTFKDRRSKAVRILDCRNHTWRDAPNMSVARKRAKSCFLDGKIYVVGGCRRTEQWAEIFDLKTQTWKPLPCPSDEVFDPNHKVEVFGGKLKHKNYAYDSKEGRWKELLLEEGLGTEPMNGPLLRYRKCKVYL